MASSVDIDEIDTNVRHALGILDLVMDNLGHRVDSSQDSMEYALWSATKHLKEVVNEIEYVGKRNLSELLSKVDPDPLGDDEDDEESFFESDDDEDEDETFVLNIGIKKDGTISLLKDADK